MGRGRNALTTSWKVTCFGFAAYQGANLSTRYLGSHFSSCLISGVLLFEMMQVDGMTP